MALFLTMHAWDQMTLRSITRDEVTEAHTRRDTTYRSEDYPDERLVILGTTSAGRRLKIVVPINDQNTIITVADRDAWE